MNINQQSAFTKLVANKVGALFMKMGTGKTRVAVELVNSIPDADLICYIAPLGIIRPKSKDISPISDEVAKWGGFRCESYYVGIESIQGSDRIFLETTRKIEQAKCPVIVVDESIKIKNIDAKRTKRLMELSKMVDYKLILNGTPFTKNLMDIYPQMEFLSPLILQMKPDEFKNTFCCYTTITKCMGGHRKYTKEFITGYENVDYLYRLIGEFVYECDLQLNIQQVFTDIRYTLSEEEREEYEALKTKYLDNEVLQRLNNNIFLEMTQKMQHSYCCTEDKFAKVDELFQTIPEEDSIIFCKYIASREACKKRYPKATVLNYQQDSFGHNLPHLNRMIFFDKHFDWALRNQAQSRNARLSTERDLYYYDLTGNVGLENIINLNIKKKTDMITYFRSISKTQLKEIL